MLVSELIELLSEYPGDMRVLKAADEEWNSIYQVHGVDPSLSDDPEAWEVPFVNEEDVENEEYYDYGLGRYATVEDYVKVLVIT